MDYSEALAYIHAFGAAHNKKRPLLRTRALLDELGSPDRALRFVHIAGTNGKGSVAAMTESILRASGYKTGLFTSPYITRFNERIRVNGEDIQDSELAELVERVRPFIDRLPDKPTEFEVVTVLGLCYFAEAGCDVVVLEAGMGGRDDFTNVIDPPLAAAVTSVGMDHVKQLGTTERDIARAKAGIIKPGSAAIFAGAGRDASRVIRAAAKKAGAPVCRVKKNEVRLLSSGLEGCRFSFREWKDVFIPLAGTYQPQNAAVAILICLALRERGFNIPDRAVLSGIGSVKWRGRFEILRRDPLIILDGAHNPPAAEATARSLRDALGREKVVFLIGVMADKDAESIIRALAPAAERFVTVAADYPRAMPAEELRGLIASMGLKAEAAASVSEGVRRASLLAGREGAVCALGSLYLSQTVREAVEKME